MNVTVAAGDVAAVQIKESFKNNWYFLLVSRRHFRLCRFVTKLQLCSSPATPKFLPDTLSIKIPLISLQLLSEVIKGNL